MVIHSMAVELFYSGPNQGTTNGTRLLSLNSRWFHGLKISEADRDVSVKQAESDLMTESELYVTI